MKTVITEEEHLFDQEKEMLRRVIKHTIDLILSDDFYEIARQLDPKIQKELIEKAILNKIEKE